MTETMQAIENDQSLTYSSQNGEDKGNRTRQVALIAKWLQDEAIGFDADAKEMENYAEMLVAHGLHSVQMIQEMCSPGDIMKFSWMKEFHKRRLLQSVNQSKSNKDNWCRQLSSIAQWLENDIIGFDSDPLEMALYAQKFVDLGFHSPVMIQDVCSGDDVASFAWMKPVHKRLLVAKGKLKMIKHVVDV